MYRKGLVELLEAAGRTTCIQIRSMPNIGAEIITNTIWGFLIVSMV